MQTQHKPLIPPGVSAYHVQQHPRPPWTQHWPMVSITARVSVTARISAGCRYGDILHAAFCHRCRRHRRWLTCTLHLLLYVLAQLNTGPGFCCHTRCHNARRRCVRLPYQHDGVQRQARRPIVWEIDHHTDLTRRGALWLKKRERCFGHPGHPSYAKEMCQSEYFVAKEELSRPHPSSSRTTSLASRFSFNNKLWCLLFEAFKAYLAHHTAAKCGHRPGLASQ